jgi:hypothetical protein
MRRLLLIPLAAVALLAAAGSAQAAVTASNVTSPADGSFIRFDTTSSPGTISVSGTSNGTTGDQVDLYCTRGAATSFHASLIVDNLAVNADGSFTYNGSPSGAGDEACVIRALPGADPTPTSATDLSQFTGPRVYLGEIADTKVAGGPNGGLLWDYFLYNSQTQGGMGYDSLGFCGLDESFVYNPSTLAKSKALFWCNAWFWYREGDMAHGTRSEIQVDGRNAYPPAAAASLFTNSEQNPGFLPITYSPSFAPGTSDLTISESDPFLYCPGNPFPPTAGNCPTFERAPIDVQRSIAMDALGRQVRITDTYTSRDGAAHPVDMLYEQDFFSNTTTAYRFPWRDTGYLQHALNDTFPGPGGTSPGSIYIKGNKDAADGDETDPQGAITYSTPPEEIRFLNYPTQANQFWAMHYRRTVPATGSLTFTFVFSNAFLASDVNAMAAAAEASLRPPTGGGPGGGGGGGLPGTTTFKGVSLRAKRLTVSKGKATLDLACPAGAVVSCSGTATLTATSANASAAAKKKKRKPAVYGKARFTIAAGKHKKIKLKLTKAGRSALRHHPRKLRARLTIAARDKGGHKHTTKVSTTLVAKRGR